MPHNCKSCKYQKHARYPEKKKKASGKILMQQGKKLDFGKLEIAAVILTDRILYIHESNPHPFYSFRGLKNQMWIRIAYRLDLRS